MLRTYLSPLLQKNTFLLKVFKSVSVGSFHSTQICGGELKDGKSKESTSVAIILCGCGYLDGTEISEAVSATIHVCEEKLKPCFYAPDVLLATLLDHQLKEVDVMSSARNVLIESARISRSVIQPLCECDACKHGALVIPGGFGAAKTLSDFADKGAECKVIPDLVKIIEDFYCEKKPIASICIASVLIAKILKGVKITLGKENPENEWPHASAIKKVQEMGAEVEMKSVTEVTECKKYKVLSTPAWMCGKANYAEIHEGIGNAIGMMKKHMNSK